MRKITKKEACLVHKAVEAEMAEFQKSKTKGTPLEQPWKKLGWKIKTTNQNQFKKARRALK